MKHLNFLIKPASSLCNMRCRYCFYADISAERDIPSYGIMAQDTADKIIENIFKDMDDKDEITLGFQGGEPTLAGLPWFRHFVDNVTSRKRDTTVHYAFQTNGLLLDEPFCKFFKENDFLIGLSIDAGKRFHDRYRFSASGGETYAACMQSKELLEKNHVEYNILCVLTNDLANEPEKVWNFILNEKIRYIQFIPCLEPPPDHRPEPKHLEPWPAGTVLRPAQFAAFYSRLLPLWIKELENGNYISVKFFDEVVNYFCRGIPTSCGIDGRCHNQYVIEADGSVYPCDFYAFDQYKIGNLAESTPGQLFDTEKVRDFLREKPEPSKICESCRFFKACRGGCKRMRNVMYAGAGICGYRSFLEKCFGPLELTVRKVLGNEALR